jgi:SAM-dependent methyltransferase
MLTETEFYDRLAAFFDVMTDWHSRLAAEMPFLEATLARHNAREVLDCACGTGWHAIALAQRGYRVAASDISAAMIARARQNAEREGVTIPFAIARFQDLRATFRERFDAVLCLGNSFVHVLTDDAALDSLANMRDCLREDGVLILHNLNYDKRWKDKPRWFGVNAGILDGCETLIWRFADYHDDAPRSMQNGTRNTQYEPRITFNIALFTKNADGAWSADVQSTLQRSFQRTEFGDLLRRVGFSGIEFYGNLQGEAYDAARSADLVVVAEQKE